MISAFSLYLSIFHRHVLLMLGESSDTIFWVVFFCTLPVVFYFHWVKVKKEALQKEIDEVSDAVFERLRPQYDAIKQSKKEIVKAISQNSDDPDLLFFLNAILKNFSIRENKLLLIKRMEQSGYVSWNTEAIQAHDKQVIEELYNSPAPVYTDFATVIDPVALEIYTRLSKAYMRLGLRYKEPIDNEYEVDWGNGYFYYVKVGRCRIPYFRSEKNEQVYIYPKSVIVCRDDVEFDHIPLTKITVEHKLVENAVPKTALVTIKEANLEFATDKIAAPQEFYNELLALQKHLKDTAVAKRQEEGKDREIDELNRILQDVRKLIGLEKVKEDLISVANYIKIQQLRQLKGLKVQTVSYHCVFTGNPGTGKTTIARMLAKVYKELGVIKNDNLVEVDRSKLVAEYVGQTAVKTNKVIDEALDGILFIDEAYSLVQSSNDDFGAEAISTLLKRMEDDRDRLVVVLAGYGDEMKDFIDSNPGLQSRFTRYLHFDDYSVSELREIFDKLVETNDYILTPEAAHALNAVIADAVARKTSNFGNARFVRNLFEKTCEKQATRLSKETSLDDEKLRTLEAVDIPAGF